MTTGVSAKLCGGGGDGICHSSPVAPHGFAGASILGLGYLLPMCYLLWSLRWGEHAPANPWQAPGLEWQTPSPPPHHNFERTPVVTGPPYEYPGVEVEVG